jgi:tRNA U55 pseudouridine synthase TruB
MLAREGIEVERPPRRVHIASLRLWRDSPAQPDVRFIVGCSTGTYVRSLALDLVRARRRPTVWVLGRPDVRPWWVPDAVRQT